MMTRWPVGGYALPAKAISVVCAGPRQDQDIEHRYLKLTNVGSDQLDALIQVEACTQPLQMDVWAKTWDDRDDIVARLDDLMHTGAAELPNVNAPPTGHGVILTLEDGWEPSETYADYDFENPDFDETANALERSQFRAIYRGNSRFMLTVQRRLVRQKTVNLSLLLKESDETVGRDLYTISGA